MISRGLLPSPRLMMHEECSIRLRVHSGGGVDSAGQSWRVWRTMEMATQETLRYQRVRTKRSWLILGVLFAGVALACTYVGQRIVVEDAVSLTAEQSRNMAVAWNAMADQLANLGGLHREIEGQVVILADVDYIVFSGKVPFAMNKQCGTTLEEAARQTAAAAAAIMSSGSSGGGADLLTPTILSMFYGWAVDCEVIKSDGSRVSCDSV
jgi:hypothetical protein